MRAGRRAQLFVLVDDITFGQRDDELVAVAGAEPGHITDLRVFDREGCAFSHLPANQLVQVLSLGGYLIESHDRDLADDVGNEETDAAGPANSVEQTGKRAG